MQGKNNGERKNKVKKIEDSICSILLHFWSTSQSPFSACYMSFRSSGSQKSNASNGCDSELKWRSYSHWKPITPSWRKNFARLRNHPFVAKWFRSHFAQCCGIPPEVSRYLRHVGNRAPQAESQLRSAVKSAFCCEKISQPFLCVYEISQISFSPTKWSLVLPDISDRHFWIFCFRFLMFKSSFSPCNPPIIGFLSY